MSSPQRHARSRRELRGLRAPQEHEAEDRAWAVVRSAYLERSPRPRRRTPWRFALAPAALVIGGVLALTPAGAAVHRWIDRSLGVPHASPALASLPAPGKLLVSGPAGAWTVAGNGIKRHLGPWGQASWSPHAIYVAAAQRGELAALDTRGNVRWALARPDVSFPRWFAPSGYRVAYLSGATLRIVAGDGTADRALAAHVSRIAPAWRPAHAYQLAYASPGSAIVVREADTGVVRWSRQLSSAARVLAWSADGGRLLVLTRRQALVFDGNGQRVARVALTPARGVIDAALSPRGHSLALLTRGDLSVMTLPPSSPMSRRIFSGNGLRQLAWSPDGQWLLVSWPAANQWIFVRTVGPPRLAAISRIAEQFSPGSPSHPFPRLDGWCCTNVGGAG